ncbi:MAG: DUF2608 domain-containing protein [Woeseiaceae bacterium]
MSSAECRNQFSWRRLEGLLNAFLVCMLVLVTGCASTPETQPPQISVQTTEAFSDVDAAVAKATSTFTASRVLVVLDIDNTLLTSQTDLGGDIWYQWQTDRLRQRPAADQKVKCLFEDAIGLLYELAPMQLTDLALPDLIKRWQDQGNTVFALTSRSPRYRTATERELARAGIDLTRASLTDGNGQAPLYREKAAREWSYMQGIMMTTGMNKGEMLSMLLQRTGVDFDAVIFVDDTRKHIDHLSETFEDAGPKALSLFHFTKVEADRERRQGEVLTSMQAEGLARDWQTLNETLLALFPGRSTTDGCLGQ